MKWEGSRLLVNVVKSTSQSAEGLGFSSNVKWDRIVKRLAETLRTGMKHTILINESVIALALVSTFGGEAASRSSSTNAHHQLIANALRISGPLFSAARRSFKRGRSDDVWSSHLKGRAQARWTRRDSATGSRRELQESGENAERGRFARGPANIKPGGNGVHRGALIGTLYSDP